MKQFWATVCLLFLAACGTPPSSPEGAPPDTSASVGDLVAQLRPNDPNALEHNLHTVRQLQALGSVEAVDPLIALLAAPQAPLAEAAAAALGEIPSRAALGPLSHLVRHPQTAPPLARLAVRALGRIGGAQAVGPLIRALYNPQLTNTARAALVRIGHPAVSPLIQTAESGHAPHLPAWAVETGAAIVLGNLSAQEATPTVCTAFSRLYGAYEAAPHSITADMYIALGDLAVALGRLGGTEPRRLLLQLLAGHDEGLRRQAAVGLSLAGPDGPTGQALLRAARSGSPATRTALLTAAGRVGSPNLLPAIDALDAAPTDAGDLPVPLRHQLLQQIREPLRTAQRCQRQTACWVRALQQPEPEVQVRAALQLSWLHKPEARDAAEPLLLAIISSTTLIGTDAATPVQCAAAVALQRLSIQDARDQPACWHGL